MAALCYRCMALHDIPSDPAGACWKCSSFACLECGNRVPRRSRYSCVLCFSGVELLPSGGLPPSGGGPGGSGPDTDDEPPGGGDFAEEPAFASSEEFERLLPVLAEATSEERRFFHEGGLREVLSRTERYAMDEIARQDIDAEVGYERYGAEEEAARREAALRTAQLLTRQLETARAREAVREELLADAFGVAHWSIGVRIGEEPTPERLALLPDERLRFVIAYAMPSFAV